MHVLAADDLPQLDRSPVQRQRGQLPLLGSRLRDGLLQRLLRRVPRAAARRVAAPLRPRGRAWVWEVEQSEQEIGAWCEQHGHIHWWTGAGAVCRVAL